MKNIIILGSTGSIGVQTLEVVEKLSDKFNIKALACGNNIELLKEQIKKFKPDFVCIKDKNKINDIKKEFNNIEIYYGEEGLIKLAQISDYDILVSATNGIVSVRATLEAIKNKKT